MKIVKYTLLPLILTFLVLQLNSSKNLAETISKNYPTPQSSYTDYFNKFNNFRHKVINIPIDVRPISNEYLENLVNLGGDILLKIDEENLDKGPSDYGVNNWINGNSENLRNDLNNLIKKNNKKNSTVIINSSSFIYGGLVYSRVPTSYNNNSINKALEDLDMITKYNSLPRYYFHVMMPRVIPETRGDFDYKSDYKDYGLTHFYNISLGDTNDNNQNKFTDLLIEYGYVKTKFDMGYKLETFEENFLNYFVEKFIEKATEDFKYNNTPIATMYENIFKENGNLIINLMDRIQSKSIDEIIISMDDYVIPTFINTNKDKDWVLKDENNNPIKFSFGKKYIVKAMEYQEQIFGENNLKNSKDGTGDNINYIFGTDEIPQMIYSRDLTRRKGFATNFFVDYSKDKNPEQSKNHIGKFEAETVEKLINQRINFVTRKSDNGYQKNILKCDFSKKFILFVHNSDLKNENGSNYFYSQDEANEFSESVYESFNQGNNVGVLDLATNIADWNLFSNLSSYKDNSINQLSCYSAFNTIGNSTGLGISHAQVFGIIDFWGDKYLQIDERIKAQSKILSQHLLEDAIYNTKIKNTYPRDYQYIKSNINTILNNSIAFDNNQKPGGQYWVMDKFTKKDMSLSKTNYIWNSTYTFGDLPIKRTFECIINTDFSGIKKSFIKK